MDEREKIAQLLCKQTGSNENRECESCPFNGCIAQRQADALIAAGIGDVSWWERKCKLCEEDWFLQKKQIEHYAESYKELLQEDLDKYKHRAEVAEKDLERHKRALSCACYDKARTYCPNDDWREVAKKFEHDYLQQSEKELAEEGKYEKY